MESNINLDSIRELSNSQLEALLRYDSPPETPIQSTDFNITKNSGEPKTFNSFMQHNREQFDSQIGSQIDFSVFNRYASSALELNFSPLKLQNTENDDDCIKINSPLNTIEIVDVSMKEKDKDYFNDDTFIDNTFATNFLTISQSHKEAESGLENSCEVRKEYDFEEVDNIFKNIEFNNLGISHINKLDSSNSVLRKCQTQFQPKAPTKNSQTKMISSCPTYAGNQLQQPSFTSMSKDENELNKAIIQCTTTHDTIAIDDIFEKSQPQFLFDCSSSLQKQSQAQNKKNSCLLFNENFLKDNKSQTHCTPKSLTNVNTLADTSTIPLSVKQLYDIVKTNHSDFAFIYALSSQLCQDRVPMECFVTLKIALLLSLVSIGNNENRPPIPIVAISNDTYMTDYLMTNIGQLGSRFLGPVDETKSFSTANWIEADAIILARGGVFYAGDWTRLKLRRAETIFNNIECSSVAVEKSPISVPLETAIWTHWRSFKYGAKDQQTFNKFLKIFGIPVFVSDDHHEALIDYILDQASVRVFESTIDHLSINNDDMRNFLICVSQNNVDLSPEASLLLKDYFVASRSMRQDCLSKQSYAMLKQFAESFAKLSMRKVVLSGDAIAAIILCEDFIENVFGPTDNCPPHFGNFDFVGAVDEYFLEFKKWLESFIKTSQTKC